MEYFSERKVKAMSMRTAFHTSIPVTKLVDEFVSLAGAVNHSAPSTLRLPSPCPTVSSRLACHPRPRPRPRLLSKGLRVD
jgi:hypothetical protein